MRGLDYRWIEALDEIIAQGSFEKAAETLCISQSAVSQRIKQLEKWLAQPVLVRQTPPKVTPAGQKLLGLYRQVCVLEQDILPQLNNDGVEKPVAVSIATNADSLATWLLPALGPLIASRKVEINLLVDDEHRTIEKLKNGEVVGAISQSSKTIPGCQAVLLGNMPYLCVCSPEFYQRYFAEGVTGERFQVAPSVAFDQQDFINERFVQAFVGHEVHFDVKHSVGSSEACVKAALHGFGFALIPEIQIRHELKQGKLVDVLPGHFIDQQLYWHHWQLESGMLKTISQSIVAYARKVLPQD
ncbi:LysR family transcriptional regulator ArgP [Vibrio fluvialis]|uniref:LysR family transcriptional regulator ArgP n=1 Tax=Vibrio sp. bablab_jr001 TaxID=2755067 RepID=UPI0018F11F33|nr:LysR family transcriptional regulator ArgP [Vibrio sp. bablab_jr001]EKO3400719.1 LysR family transcriptional regulator ArgP [Vibrio fluvialis]EKO3472790.1 LysR family transcriptional regulator ArgP [Vibrio fluvialis]MBY8115490.1 LysR family transcriptional regulator ArgP [Vibrio fluvialis]MBY8248772.1 LysR family transcriptional regulator ArgP [Vibrio fluvialis]MBY8282251.1 LysR family transcriptional regulator ArgP [Vibrio fluvialis]